MGDVEIRGHGLYHLRSTRLLFLSCVLFMFLRQFECCSQIKASGVDCLRDKYPRYAALAAKEIKWTPRTRSIADYRILVDDLPESKCLVMAIHGGAIEPYTSELASAFVGTCKVYRFEGHKPRGNKDLHITSNCFDEPLALDLVQTATTCVSLHGMSGQDENVICVGGRNAVLKERFVEAAREYPSLPFTVHQCDHPMCANFGGSSKHNIVNKCSSEGGLQLEISRKMRDEMKASPGQTPTEKALIHLIKTAMNLNERNVE